MEYGKIIFHSIQYHALPNISIEQQNALFFLQFKVQATHH